VTRTGDADVEEPRARKTAQHINVILQDELAQRLFSIIGLQTSSASILHLTCSRTTTLNMATLLTQETAAKSSHQGPTTTVYEKGLQVGNDVNRITKIETFRVRPRWLFVRVETSKASPSVRFDLPIERY
jgi:hypothetical protein